MSAFDAVDGASSAASKWYRMIASKPERFKEVMPGNEMAFEVFKELARTRRRNADTVDPGIGRTRLGQRTLKCVFLIGTRSAHSIRASGLTAAQTGRTHDRTRPMLQQRQKVLAKALADIYDNGTSLLTLTRVACISPKGNCQAKASRQIIRRSATLFANGERHENHATRSDHWQFQSPCWVSVRRISTS